MAGLAKWPGRCPFLSITTGKHAGSVLVFHHLPVDSKPFTEVELTCISARLWKTSCKNLLALRSLSLFQRIISRKRRRTLQTDGAFEKCWYKSSKSFVPFWPDRATWCSNSETVSCPQREGALFFKEEVIKAHFGAVETEPAKKSVCARLLQKGWAVKNCGKKAQKGSLAEIRLRCEFCNSVFDL